MSKIRLGFVTNSSSSSFVIAKNDKCTKEEIKEKLLTMREEIKDFLYDFDYHNDISEDDFIDEMTKILFKIPGDLILGEWAVSAREYSNENDEFDGFMYEYGHELDTENFKVEPSGW